MPLLSAFVQEAHIVISNKSFEDLYNGETLQLLLEYPGTARYVLKLEIRVPEPSFSFNCFSASPQLTRLQSLTILTLNSTGLYHIIYWQCFPSPTQHSLLNLMHLPTLTHLDVRRITYYPKSNLIVCSNVEHLSLHRLDIIGASSPLCCQSVKLQTLDISVPALKSLMRLEETCSDGRLVLDFTGLVKLPIALGGLETHVAPPIIKHIFRKIERLRDVSFQVDGM